MSKHTDLTRKIIGVFFKVYNTLGYGFSEKVYENALVLELKKPEPDVKQQRGKYRFSALLFKIICGIRVNLCPINFAV